MAALETLRTKAGVFVSVIIGVALLAFIVNADTLATARAIFSSDDDMGEIAGTTITREEYDMLLNYNTELYKLNFRLNYGQDPVINDEVNTSLRDQTWQELVLKYMMGKEYDNLGLKVTDAELFELTLGMNPSPMVIQTFTNPQTGSFDRAALANFIQNLQGETKIFWVNIEKQIKDQQLINKYSALDTKSNFVNSLDVEHAMAGEKKNVEFSYLLKNYNTVADSLITYKESDLKSYYNNHKAEFKQTRSRDIEYVSFNVTPSATDYERVMNRMEDLQKQMDTVAAKNMPLFVRLNSDVPFSNKYSKIGQLPEVLDTVVFQSNPGDVFPYYQEGNAYLLSGIVEFKNMPDSMRIEHILFDQTNFQIADSILELIKGGANFAELAREHSQDPGSKEQGGDLGWIDYDNNQFIPNFIDSAFLNPLGTIVKVPTMHGIHIVKTTDAKKYNNRALIATVTKNILPGKETYQTYYAQANKIATAAKGGIESFRQACVEEGVQPQIEPNIRLESKTIGRFTDPSNLRHWVYTAEQGDISGVLEVENRNTYVVAALTNVRKAGIAPFKQVKNEIAVRIIREKKGEYLSNEMTTAMNGINDIDGLASKMGGTVQSVTPAINFNTTYVPTLMTTEYKLIGAVTNIPENKLSGPLAGEAGVYAYTVTSITDNAQAQTPEAIKSRLEMELGYRNFYSTLTDRANIVDNRGKFY